MKEISIDIAKIVLNFLFGLVSMTFVFALPLVGCADIIGLSIQKSLGISIILAAFWSACYIILLGFYRIKIYRR